MHVTPPFFTEIPEMFVSSGTSIILPLGLFSSNHFNIFSIPGQRAPSSSSSPRVPNEVLNYFAYDPYQSLADIRKLHGLIECVRQEVESKSIVVNGVESGRGKLGTDGTRSGFWSMMNRNGARQKGKTYPSGESVIFRVENRDAILACARFVRTASAIICMANC